MTTILDYGRCLALAALIFTLIGLQPATPAWAQSGYELDWWTVDGGGASLGGSSGYSLSGTVGQPDAAAVGGGSPGPYGLSGGFWVTGPTAAGYEIFLPVVVRGGS